MPAYRAYVLDRADHISGTEVIEAVSLRDAVHAGMALLRGLPDDQSIELWRAENRLCSLPPSTYVRRAREIASRLAQIRGAGQAA